MRIKRTALLIVVALSLSGCEALSAVGGGIFTTISSGGVQAFQDKVRLRTEHTVEAKRLFGNMVRVLEAKAEGLADEGKYDEAFTVYDYIYERHEAIKPEFMLIKGVQALKERREAKQVHELELERISVGETLAPTPQ